MNYLNKQSLIEWRTHSDGQGFANKNYYCGFLLPLYVHVKQRCYLIRHFMFIAN